ncbi:MAG: dihydropteroate synthase [Proteobacteria bacterium]|nr:dihydropteroate synthase [Pseudomonadota bacterium]
MSEPLELQCAGRRVALATPCVMGVLNVTPDSFSDGGRYLAQQAAIEHGLRMVTEGATFIDVGGESTRPGAEPVSVAEELARVVPVVRALAASSAVISVDTSKPEVMRAAAEAGAGLINDVRALSAAGALEAARDSGCAVCLMHMQGEPRTMQREPHYADVTAEVGAFLGARLAACESAGIARRRLAIDPGFGFGKNAAHNLTLLRQLRDLTRLGVPVLAGLSRKSWLGKLTGRDTGERLAGSLALAVIAALHGARIIRAHDVAATVDVLRVVAAVEGGG